MNIIFLDIDGVLNCEQFYKERMKLDCQKPYPLNQICTERVAWLNELCESIKAKVVVSSTWRHDGLEAMQNLFKQVGGTFEVIDITPSLGRYTVRGNEIRAWIENNSKLLGCYSSDFHTYAIIDDDSDMLLWQRDHFFQTDTYSGLTPNTCYRITRFFQKLNSIPTNERSVATAADKSTEP
jgi:hypothetical protein